MNEVNIIDGSAASLYYWASRTSHADQAGSQITMAYLAQITVQTHLYYTVHASRRLGIMQCTVMWSVNVGTYEQDALFIFWLS